MCQRESPGDDRGFVLPDFPSLGFAPIDDLFRGRVFHAFEDVFKVCHVPPYLLRSISPMRPPYRAST